MKMFKKLILAVMLCGVATPVEAAKYVESFKPWVSPTGDEIQQKEAYLSIATCLVKAFCLKILGKYGVQYLGCPTDSSVVGRDCESFVAKMASDVVRSNYPMGFSEEKYARPQEPWTQIKEEDIKDYDPSEYVVKARFTSHSCVMLSDGYWYQKMGAIRRGNTEIIRSPKPAPKSVLDSYGPVQSFWVRARDKSVNTKISAMEMDFLKGSKNGCDGGSLEDLILLFSDQGVEPDCLNKMGKVDSEESLFALYEFLMEKQRRALGEDHIGG